MYREVKSDKDINTLTRIAYEIWSTHFSSMFDAEILPKLIEGVQSKSAILKDINKGYKYFFIFNDDKILGYFAYKILHQENELFLNKLYIYSEHRGKGLGKKVLIFLENICKESGIDSISLTVFHKNTNSIKAYENWGFNNLGLIKKIFSKDLIFDDYRMLKTVKKRKL